MCYREISIDRCDVVELEVDLSEDAGLAPGSLIILSKVRGDAASYATILANDFKANNPDLFPIAEVDIPFIDLDGGDLNEVL